MSAVRLVSAAVLPLLLAACSRDAAPEAAPAPPAVAAPAPEAPPLAPEARKLADVPDSAIAEGPTSRDPFRTFSTATPPPKDTRPRKSRHFALDQLKLVGLVTGTPTPRAMLVDPTGKGWVVTPGELVGSPEPVREGDRVASASWRVDRIREGDVVLVREDAAHRDAPIETKVLALPREPVLAAIDD
jgi:type IV pilus assembly protein PilP